MGGRLSAEKIGGSRSPCMIVTLDALGTLYRFREPVYVQYRKVAHQCGLKASYSDHDLESSFKRAYKDHNTRFPNYGKATAGHGTPSDPRVWWENVVEDTFQPLISKGETLPSNLGASLYDHFSSSSAYELFPDVPQFLSTLKRLRTQLDNSPEGTMLMTGIITNSDPRVRQILSSLGVTTGISDHKPDASHIKDAVANYVNHGGHRPSYFSQFYQPQTIDFDFLLTSYNAEYPKPDPRIFQEVRKFAAVIRMAKLEQADTTEDEEIPPPPSTIRRPLRNLRLPSTIQMLRYSRDAARTSQTAFHLHIGDDINEDFGAALVFGGEPIPQPLHSNRFADALWLLREGAAQISGTSARVTIKELDYLRDVGRGMIARSNGNGAKAAPPQSTTGEPGVKDEMMEIVLEGLLPAARTRMVSNLVEASAVLGMMVEERLGPEGKDPAGSKDGD